MARLLDDWITAYKAYTYELEAPDEYHTWVGLNVLAGAIRRNVWFDMSYFILYPNLYVVLVSPPGVGTKSTAMGVGKKILATIPNIKTSSDSVSRKQLIVDLRNSKVGNQSAMTIYSSEFATLIGTSKIEMVVLLTDLYDCPTPKWEHRTETGGIHIVENPYVNMIAGTTPDQFAKTMPLDVVGTGLASRTIFVWGDEPRVRPWRPTPNEAQRELAKLLAADLNHISTLQGEFNISPEANTIYDHWYRELRPTEHRIADSRIASYYARKRSHLLKVSMLMSLSRRDSLIIEAQDVQDALDLLAETERGMPFVYGGVGKNPLAGDINELLVEMLQRPHGATLNELLDKFKYSVRLGEVKEILDTLILTKHIVLEGNRYYLAPQDIE